MVWPGGLGSLGNQNLPAATLFDEINMQIVYFED